MSIKFVSRGGRHRARTKEEAQLDGTKARVSIQTNGQININVPATRAFRLDRFQSVMRAGDDSGKRPQVVLYFDQDRNRGETYHVRVVHEYRMTKIYGRGLLLPLGWSEGQGIYDMPATWDENERTLTFELPLQPTCPSQS